MSLIKIKKLNESYVTILGLDIGLAKTLSEYFSFYAENYKYTPKYRSGFWDGKIRLFNIKTHTLPIGCWLDAYKLLKSFNETVKVDKQLKSDTEFIDEYYIKHFINNVEQQTIEPRQYQLTTIAKAFKYQKAFIISPTSSGKSFVISLIIDIAQYIQQGLKVLLIVPNVSLIYQMRQDIVSYHKNAQTIENKLKLIYDIKYDLKEHYILEPNTIVISTWQALQTKQNIPNEFFEQFGMVIVDEAHTAGAKQLSNIVQKCTNAKFKFGFTGTLPDNEARLKQLQALFGKKLAIVTTNELIEAGYVSPLKIYVYMLKYTHDKYKQLAKMKSHKKYWLEVDKILNHPQRIEFIANLLFELQGVTLYLFKNIENKFSQKLLDAISSKVEQLYEKGNYMPVYYIDGSTPASEREMIRQKVIEANEGIIVASFGVFSQGINIPNLKNVVFAEPTKSKIKTLQSIGRALRKHELKNEAHLIDIVDVLPGKNNYLYKHFKARLTMYKQEQFTVELKGKYEITTYYDGEKTNGS